MAHLAGSWVTAFEGTDLVSQRHRFVWPMKQEQIDVAGPEPLEAFVDRGC